MRLATLSEGILNHKYHLQGKVEDSPVFTVRKLDILTDQVSAFLFYSILFFENPIVSPVFRISFNTCIHSRRRISEHAFLNFLLQYTFQFVSNYMFHFIHIS